MAIHHFMNYDLLACIHLLDAEVFEETVVLGHLGLEIVDGDAAGLLRVLPGRQAGGVLVQRGRLQRNNTN